MTKWWFFFVAVCYRPRLLLMILRLPFDLRHDRWTPRGIAVELPWRWRVESWENPWTKQQEGPDIFARYVTFYFRMLPLQYHPEGGWEWHISSFTGPVESLGVRVPTFDAARTTVLPRKPEGENFAVV